MRVASLPSNLILPRAGLRSPASVRSSVVLPAPLRPRIATAPRDGTLRLTSNSAWLVP